MLLKGFTRDVQGKIIGINDAFHKSKIFRHHFLEIVSDENTSYVQLDVVGLFTIVVEHGARGGLGDEENGSERHFAFSHKVNFSQRIIAVLKHGALKNV